MGWTSWTELGGTTAVACTTLVAGEKLYLFGVGVNDKKIYFQSRDTNWSGKSLEARPMRLFRRSFSMASITSSEKESPTKKLRPIHTVHTRHSTVDRVWRDYRRSGLSGGFWQQATCLR